MRWAGWALLLGCAACGDSPRAGMDGAVPPVDAGSDAGSPPSDAAADVRVVESFSEASGPVPEPGTGFYLWEPRADRGLVFFHEDLDDWCADPVLPASYLSDLDARLGALVDADQRAILRFRYSDDGSNPCTRVDAMSIDVVLAHIAALAPLFAEHVAMIAYVEAGFLGQWGEWNDVGAPPGTALADSATNRGQVIDALLAAAPAPIPILVRRPRFHEEQSVRLPADALARLGFHNDCFLASDTDQGTYDGARSVDAWKDYIRAAAATVPMGGETCADTLPFTSCESAVPELERLRFSYLHLGYHEDVIQRWRDEGCFDEIERRLGHRLVLRRLTLDAAIRRGRELQAELEIENVGFAPAYGQYDAQLVLSAAGTRVVLETTTTGSLAGVLPGERETIGVRAMIRGDQAAGAYELRLCWDSGLITCGALSLANEERDALTGETILGPIEIE